MDWLQLKDAFIEGGIPFNRVHGMHAFEYPGKDPRFNHVFNTAMMNHTTLVMNNILDAYKGFDQHLNQVIVDVGGGLGVSLGFITSKYPSIKGINFDLPHIIQHAPPIPRDAIFMKVTTDDDCLKLLKNCYKAIPDEGKIVVVDCMLPDVPNTSSGVRATCQADVVMMTQNPGGKERTKQELEALLSKAGFSGIKYECYVCNLWVMELFK
ncbi:hypothetical protein ES288_D05G076100v1 [Gossypium darwinii]|uniref:O-methyltransferase C-terminal domain-containing protein n=1 Tax=Gossypium darwinii TaxID=34276 RepID=A0A5D2CFD8_GOSDA|nr:hypothetical protein ES288_D05G076100v1 [Gossypium darwinii]